LIDAIAKGKIVGLDLVEIKPLRDNEVTEFLAVRCIFEVLSKLKL